MVEVSRNRIKIQLIQPFLLEYHCCRCHTASSWLQLISFSGLHGATPTNGSEKTRSIIQYPAWCSALYGSISACPSNECWLVVGVYADYARIRQGVWHAVKLLPWLMIACSVDESYRQCSEVYRHWFSPSALFCWRRSRGIIQRSQSQVRNSVCSTFFIFFIYILTLAYSDTGIGLSATEIDLLFVPFQQADVSKFILHLANKLKRHQNRILRHAALEVPV